MDTKSSTPRFEDQPNAIDIQSNCIETTLLAHHHVGEAPICYKNQPDTLIKEDVLLWWNLLQETACALNQLDRTIWTRTEGVGRLVNLRTLIEQLGATKLFVRGGARIEHFRKLTIDERTAIDRLNITLHHYQALAC